ncbi:unnamed protein product [Aphanomyces euteiches]|nr:hypothetical protein Ae201684P_022346 [Aphanomyces euteiches]
MPTHAKHTSEVIQSAIDRVLAGDQQKHVSMSQKYHTATLKYYMSMYRRGMPIKASRMGPPPTLPPDCEEKIVQWILGMQRDGFPVARQDVLMKANEVCQLLGISEMTQGWCTRVMNRHPQLTTRRKLSPESAMKSTWMV